MPCSAKKYFFCLLFEDLILSSMVIHYLIHLFFNKKFTGDSTPYSFPVSPIRLVKEWPDSPPFRPEDFLRADSLDDSSFYTVPRLVYHIDEPAVASLTQYYRNNIPKGSDILDICSSWVSHYVSFSTSFGHFNNAELNTSSNIII